MGKNLGQHFLINDSIADDIVDGAEVSYQDTVLEIGPGKGILTRRLLKEAGQVVAVEKDPQLYKQLTTEFDTAITADKLTLEQGDIRDFTASDLIPADSNYKVVANIPYYLTSELIEKLLTSNCQPTSITLLTQKGVAERITKSSEKHSRLSLFVHAYGNPTYLQTVSKEAFSPAPKVDSALLRISSISNDFFRDIDTDIFFDLIRTGFQHKRKTIKNNLKKGFDQDRLQTALKKCDLSSQTRPEKLHLRQWQCLYKYLC